MRALLFFIPFTLLAACSTMNSHFSCNVTAGDSCLTIEEVDAMTDFADTPAKTIEKRNYYAPRY